MLATTGALAGNNPVHKISMFKITARRLVENVKFARTREEVMLTVRGGRTFAPAIHRSHNIVRRHVVSAEVNCHEKLH